MESIDDRVDRQKGWRATIKELTLRRTDDESEYKDRAKRIQRRVGFQETGERTDTCHHSSKNETSYYSVRVGAHLQWDNVDMGWGRPYRNDGY